MVSSLRFTNLLGVIFFSFLLSTTGFAKDEPSTKNLKSVKVLVHNVGGSDFVFGPAGGIRSFCPGYKLCHSDIMERVRQHIKAHQPDVILFQEVQSKAQVLVGTSKEAPLVPADFDAECVIASGNIEEVCIAWNRNKAQLVRACDVVKYPQSGAIKCTLAVDGTDIDFINLHPSVFNVESRELLLNKVWNELVVRGNRTIVGGDFNTEDDTYPVNEDSDVPYPPEFGTVFGRAVKKYGRWAEKSSFYGYRRLNEKAEWIIQKVSGSTIIKLWRSESFRKSLYYAVQKLRLFRQYFKLRLGSI
jgi:hypothetical protein